MREYKKKYEKFVNICEEIHVLIKLEFKDCSFTKD